MSVNLTAVADGNAAALLAAVLQGEEAKESEPGDICMLGMDSEDGTSLVCHALSEAIQTNRLSCIMIGASPGCAIEVHSTGRYLWSSYSVT